MAEGSCKVEFYGLSTCGWCRKTKAWLDDHDIEYDLVYMDQATRDDLKKAKERIEQFVERQSFPILIIDDGDKVIQGYQIEDFEEALG